MKLKADRGTPKMLSYAYKTGAYVELVETCYLFAEGYDAEGKRKDVELSSGKWYWECFVEDLPRLEGGELQLGVLDARNKDRHAGFNFDFKEGALFTVQWHSGF